MPSALVKTVWCEPPASSQASAAVSKSGLGFQTARATGSFGSGAGGATTSISFATRRKRSPRSSRQTTTAGPGCGREDEPDRVVAPADRERMDLAGRPAGGDRGADLEHVRAEHEWTVRGEVVGVVLHERGPAREACGHRLEDPDEGGGLPVSFGAEAEPVGHQPLHGDPGKLGETVEILERIGERAEAAVARGTRAGRPRSGLPRRAIRDATRRAGARARARSSPRSPRAGARPLRPETARTASTRSPTP